MLSLQKLDMLFSYGYLTAEEWEFHREAYENRICKLYLDGKITEEELLERLNK